jgi:hypothetical protein
MVLGVRFPLGLAWYPAKSFEVFADVAPTIGAWLLPLHFPAWDIPLEVGFRYYF